MIDPVPTDMMDEAAPGADKLALLGWLRSAISSGEIVDNGRLPPERELAESIGVGRRALRNALSHLENDGTIWRRQGHGTFVSALMPPRIAQFSEIATRTSPVELTEVRLEIEPVLARLCSLRASFEQIDRVGKCAQTAANSVSAYALATADAAFHRSIAKGANNALFLAMFDTVMAVLARSEWRAVRQRTASAERRVEMAAEHDAIVTAVANRDPVAAEIAMRRHIISVYSHLSAPAAHKT